MKKKWSGSSSVKQLLICTWGINHGFEKSKNLFEITWSLTKAQMEVLFSKNTGTATRNCTGESISRLMAPLCCTSVNLTVLIVSPALRTEHSGCIGQATEVPEHTSVNTLQQATPAVFFSINTRRAPRSKLCTQPLSHTFGKFWSGFR